MAPAESKRRVLLVTNDLGPHAGGIETFLIGLITQLNGAEIVIFTSTEPGSEKFDTDLMEKFDVVVLRDKSKMLLPTPRVTRRVLEIIEKFGCEVAWFGAAAPLGMMANKLKRNGIKKAIAISHGHEVWWAKVPIFKLAMRRIGNGCDVVTYLGEFTKNAIQKSLGEHPNLVQIAPGISISNFRPGDKPENLVTKYGLRNSPTIVCVGRLVRRKGQDKLIKAMPKIISKIPNAKLLIVGEGKIRKQLEKSVRKLNLEDNVVFTGRVSYAELPDYFLLGDLFAMPSRSRLFGLEVEGLGIVYLEASASGIPVLAGSSGGAPDAVKPGITGFVANGRDVDDIAAKAIEILSDKNLANQMGDSGRKWAEEYWSWENWGKKFSELLNR